MGRTESLTWNRLRGEPWLVEQKQQQNLPRERNGALRTARIGASQKCLTLPTLLETRFIANSLRIDEPECVFSFNFHRIAVDQIRLVAPLLGCIYRSCGECRVRGNNAYFDGYTFPAVEFLLGHAPVQTTERDPGCKQPRAPGKRGSRALADRGLPDQGKPKASVFFLPLGGRAFLQSDRNRAQHIAGRSGLAGPNLKLPGGLLHKHLDSGNDGDSLATRHP